MQKTRPDQRARADQDGYTRVYCAPQTNMVSYLSGVQQAEKASRRVYQQVHAPPDSTTSAFPPVAWLQQSDHPQDTIALGVLDCDADSRANPDYEMAVRGWQAHIALRGLAVGAAGDQKQEKHCRQQDRSGPDA